MAAASFLLAFLGLSYSSPFPQEVQVSYQTTGQSLRKTLADLSNISATPLHASSALGSEVVAVRVQQVPLPDLKTKLAELFQAHWIEEKGVPTLSQTAEDRRELENRHAHILTEAFGKALKAQVDSLSAQPAFDAQQAALFASRAARVMQDIGQPKRYASELNALAPLSPAHRAVTRIVSAFKPKDFAELPVRIRVTYSDQPNQAQRLLPEAAFAAVQQFLDEQALWSEEAALHHVEPPTKGGVAYALPDFLDQREPPTGSAAKVLVSFYRDSENGRVNVDFKIAGANGRIVSKSSSAFKPQFDVAAVPAEIRTLHHPISPSSEALEMVLGAPISQELVRNGILHPLQVEPLSIAYGATLVQAAQDENRNLVAILADKLADGGLNSRGFQTTDDYLDQLRRKGQWKQVGENWLCIAPEDLCFSQNTRVDRHTLEDYLRSATGSSFSVEQQAQYALALPDPMENFLPAQLLARLKNQMIGLQNQALLRFYGSLTNQERDRAASQGLLLSELSPSASAALEEIILGQQNPLIFSGQQVSDLYHEPTECLANGVPRDATLKLTKLESRAVFDTDKESSPFQLNQGSVDPGELAFLQFRNNHPDRYASPTDQVGRKHFRIGSLSEYLFKFTYKPHIGSSGTLQCRAFDSGESLSYADLPPTFLEQVSKRLAQIEQDELAAGVITAPKTVSSGTP